MANKKKFSSDELMEILNGYIANSTYLSKIKFSDLTKYALKMGYKDIMYLNFSRDKQIKAIVDEFNEKIQLTNYNKYNVDAVNPIKLDVNYVIDVIGSDRRKQKAVLNIFKDNADNIAKELLQSKEKIEILTKLNEEKDLKIQQLENKIKTLNTINKKEKIRKEKTDLELNRVREMIEYLINKKCITVLTSDEIENIIKRIFKVKINDLNVNPTEETTIENIKTEETISKINPNLFDL